MRPPTASTSHVDAPVEPPDEITGLPALHTWRRVYTFVLVVFVIYAVLLTIMSQVFA